MKFKIQNPSHFLSILLLFFFNAIYAQKSKSEIRTKDNIDLGWNYLENDNKNISEVKNATNWVTLNLPHSWNSQDATDNDPGYRRSASWYKKNLVISTIDSF
jgi:beta-galactosidase